MSDIRICISGKNEDFWLSKSWSKKYEMGLVIWPPAGRMFGIERACRPPRTQWLPCLKPAIEHFETKKNYWKRTFCQKCLCECDRFRTYLAIQMFMMIFTTSYEIMLIFNYENIWIFSMIYENILIFRLNYDNILIFIQYGLWEYSYIQQEL